MLIYNFYFLMLLSKSINLHLLNNCLTLKCWFLNSSALKAKKKLSLFAQKAVWASQIIKLILNPTLSDDIHKPSLRDQLINLQINNQTYQFDNKVRKQVLGLFTQGISLDKHVYTQPRIQQACQMSKGQRFIFCPNVLVTSPMFSFLTNTRQNFLLIGSLGSSKSVSIVFYQIISQILLNYLYNTNKQNKQRVQLINLGLIIPKLPKVLYWSIEQRQFNIISIKDLILRQVKQLTKQQYQQVQKCQTLEQMSAKITHYYQKKDIQIKVVGDQINYSASLVRQYNQFIVQYDKKLQTLDLLKKQLPEKALIIDFINSYSRSRKKYDEIFKKPVEDFQIILKKFEKFGRRFLYNSSLNIERQSIGLRDKIHKDCISFQIGTKNGGFSINELNFHKKIKQKGGIYDFYHFFWFQIERNTILISSQKENVQKIDKLKYLFYNQCCKLQTVSLWRFLFIRQYLTQKPLAREQALEQFQQNKLQKINQIFQRFDQKNETRIIQTQKLFSQLITDFNSYCKKRSFYNLKDFLNKNNQYSEQKYLLVEILYKLAKKLVDNNIQTLSLRKIILEDMNIKIEYFIQTGLKDRQLISLQFIEKENNIINFYLSPKQFIDIAEPLIYQSKGIDSRLLLTQMAIEKMGKDPVFRGKNVQLSLLYNLVPNTTLIFLNNNNPETFQLFKNTNFKSFNLNQNQNTKNMSLELNYQQMLKKAQQNQQKFIVGEPYYKHGDQQKYSFNSRCIDFSIIKYKKAENKFLINMFDLTIASNQNKADNFKNFIQTIASKPFLEYKNCSFEIKQTIICFRTLCKTDKQIVVKNKSPQIKSIKVVYRAFEDLIIETKQPENILGAMNFMILHSWILKNKKQLINID